MNPMNQNTMASSDSDSSIAMLMSMGFDRNQSIHALTVGGNVERAIDSLLSGDCGGSSGSGSASTNNCIHSDISQYSDASLGRSACTAIALTMACNLLKAIAATATTNKFNQGGDTIVYVLVNRRKTKGVEHSSVDEFLLACKNDSSSGDEDDGNDRNNNASKNIISTLQRIGEPKQGILSNSTDHPLGLEAILYHCQDQQSYIAAVITKPPETVLVLLPPHFSSSSSYILLDSHPRPHQLSPHYPAGSYALIHPTLAGLVASLKEIFPVMDLGDDVPEMMSMMYNSFECTPINLNAPASMRPDHHKIN
ncbi:hypothetical protein ACHAW5_004972 [Stephanodiscus triporus]|uniref:UBA domain-containing protein n=1 Tax=Stephanodiscus triporus TaxID=2934178 RepID=A0ABD3N2Y0_9STRA